MTPEGKFKIDVRDSIKNLPKSWIHIPDAFLKKGLPDCICGINGALVGLELKVEAKVTGIQKLTLSYMKHSGAVVGIVRKVYVDKKKYQILFLNEQEVLIQIFQTEIEFANFLDEVTKML